MNVGFLCIDQGLRDWMAMTYPSLNLYSEVDTLIFSHDVIILLESYQIEGKFYSLRPLWEKFMLVDKNLRYKSLIVAGFRHFQLPNYHYLYSSANELDHVISHAKAIWEKPSYPSNCDIDIRDPLSMLLKSHYKANFQDLLIEGWKKLKPIEREVCNGILIHEMDS